MANKTSTPAPASVTSATPKAKAKTGAKKTSRKVATPATRKAAITKRVNSVATPAFMAAVRRKTGATSAELREVMARVWAPTAYQLGPIAERLGFDLDAFPGKDGLTRYRFVSAKRR